MKYQYILFDLDGTLINSKVGVTKSVQYGLSQIGIVEDNLDNLDRFIGPPLTYSFMEFYGLTEAQTDQAIGHYRVRYKEHGIHENELYTGMESVLTTLKADGAILAIATSKPTFYAKKIAAILGIDRYFDTIVGSNLDGTHGEKEEIIQTVLSNLGAPPSPRALMIGDRFYDIVGANANGIDSVGAVYGFGSESELSKENATYLAYTATDILDHVK